MIAICRSTVAVRLQFGRSLVAVAKVSGIDSVMKSASRVSTKQSANLITVLKKPRFLDFQS